jgi:eukaryotic-like serine/threonine-protein kinase
MTGRSISHYEILEKLGQGGMGVVYKARDTRLRRYVAIKLLSAETLSDLDRKRRFVQEARSASALNHPNIITVYDINVEDEVAFIAMEYVDGKTLDRLIGRRGLCLKNALRCAVQIADALASAHEARIIHRDLKPSNIMVTEKGLVKVLDFGLAKLAEPRSAQDVETAVTVSVGATTAGVTREGTIVGTAAYMSPEQAQGKRLDGRSDIFSFGALLYEMITGRRAFSSQTTVSTLAAILNQEPKPAREIVPDLPREVDRVIGLCLRKDPARRFQHMDDLKVALEALKEESDSGTLAAAVPSRIPGLRRLPVLVAGAAVLVGATAWFSFRQPSKPTSQTSKIWPLTTYPGTERHPSFSPDGSQIAFSWNGSKQDNFDIYVKLVSGGPPLRLTTNAAADTAPSWSPDGTQIAFLRHVGDRGSIFLISPLGGPERKLTERPLPRVDA